jgi:serine/threonine protein kinase
MLTMVEPRASQFWQTAVRCGLVTPAKLEGCWHEIPPEKRTADAIDRRLARQAVNSGLLTVWQAQQILAGRHGGLRIDRYVLLDQIGSGGMGRVFLARDTRLSRQVALKILSRERMSNPRALARFRREAKVGAQLQHENLIRVYDEGDLGGMPYLVMEYITGQTIAQMVADQTRLSSGAACELARQVALGLDHLHQKGLLHRDVNPTNILVDRDGTAKLTDLGLAIDLADAEDVVTRDGATVGTFDYISPEQARNPRQIDTRSDIYSLGCTLYHMISGQVPFPAPSLPEKLIAHQTSEPEPLDSLVPGLPAGLSAVVHKMMSKRPENRYPRPSAAARALEPYASRARLLGEESPTPPGSRTWTDSAPAPGGKAASGAAAPSSSDPFGLSIDLGPEPTLSEILAANRSQSGDGLFGRAGVWLWAVLALLLVVLVIRYVLGGFGAGVPTQGRALGKEGAPHVGPAGGGEAPAAPAGMDEITVLDDASRQRQRVDDLSQAIGRAGARPSTIELRGGNPLTLRAGQIQHPISGPIRIRAAAGSRPMLRIESGTASAPVLRFGGKGSLTLQGLDIEFVRRGKPDAPATAFVEAHGVIRFEACRFTAEGAARRDCVLHFEGSKAELVGCSFHGFDAPVDLTLVPGASVSMEHCLLVRPPDAQNAPAEWPLRVTARTALRTTGPRLLSMSHCTFAGPGLLHLVGFGPSESVEVRLADSVARVGALIWWDPKAGTFPEGLRWEGAHDLYDVQGPTWVVADASGKQAVPGAPENLEAWAKLPQFHEDGSRSEIARFVVEPVGVSRNPADYALANSAEPRPGADPAKVASP